jgi:hypothetical protein
MNTFYKKILFLTLMSIIVGNSCLLGQKSNKSGIINQDPGFSEDSHISSKVRIGSESGLIKYVYAKIPGQWQGTPAVVAQDFLKLYGKKFGVNEPDKMLALKQIQHSPGGTHICYSQKLNEIPIYRSDLIITISTSNEIVFIANSLKNDPKPDSFIPNLSQAQALQTAKTHIDVKGIYYIPPKTELVFFQTKSNEYRLAFMVRIATDNPRGDWEVAIDATDGRILNTQNRIMYQDHVTGRGAVFNPDPLTTAGKYYGGGYSDPDGSDLDNDFLNGQRIIVDLPEITVEDSLYYLSGPYVNLTDIENPDDIFPVTTHPDSFVFTRSEQEFEDVMVYYHIDKSYRYLMSLGFDIPGLYRFAVDPHGAFGEDNSYYIGGGANFCVFGEGGVDDAEDAAVIWHEYAHALQENIVQPFGMTYLGETKSLQEGSSDYWAASYNRLQFEFGWQHIFMWDAGIVSDDSPGVFWVGRRADTNMKYPDDYDYSPDHEHDNGQIWSSALMHIQGNLGKEITDKLFIQAHYLWGSGPGFQDAARAFIQADSLLYAGVHTSSIVHWFTHHGLIQPGDYLPTISMQPLPDTENIDGPYSISMDIFPGKADLDTTNMWLIYWFDNQTVDSVVLEKEIADNKYRAEFSGPGKASVVNYYVSVTDSLNSIMFDPILAPLNYYKFYAGPDTIYPNAKFLPLEDQSLKRWPPQVVVNALDNIGIAETEVHYFINNIANSDSFLLESQGNDIFSAYFPMEPDSIYPNDSIFYRIEISDLSVAQNKVVLPDSGYFAFRVVDDGGSITFNFEFDTVGFYSNGDWQWGAPVNGPQLAYEGEKVWGTLLNNTYSNGPGLSELVLPEIDLSGFNHAQLEFWHWYDIETQFDGGNIKIRSAQQPEWRIVVPVEGYDVVIDTSFGNPMAGQTGFSGVNHDWIPARFNLDRYLGEQVELKFDFGADVTESGLGWYIDLLSVSDQEAIIAAPKKLEVVDIRDKISLEWQSAIPGKQLYSKSGMDKKKRVDQNDNTRSISVGLPSFYIYRSLSGTEYSILDSTLSTTYSDSLVKPGFRYFYYVTFSNGESESLPSDTVSATVEPVTFLDKQNVVPEIYAMFQNYPNPFNPVTVIGYQLPVDSFIDLSIYNVLGQKVTTLVSETKPAGKYETIWDATDVAGGVYLYQIKAGNFRQVRKMILLR